MCRKQTVLAENASPLFTAAPLLCFAALAVATALVPSFALGMSFSRIGDLLVIGGLLALARTVLALASLDDGTAAGGVAARQAMTLALCAEPALLFVMLALGLAAGTTNVDLIAGLQQAGMVQPFAAIVLAAAALGLIALVQRDAGMPEAAGFGGSGLALLRMAEALRLLLWLDLIGALFVPVGMASAQDFPAGWAVGLLSWIGRLGLSIGRAGRAARRRRPAAVAPGAGAAGRCPAVRGACRPAGAGPVEAGVMVLADSAAGVALALSFGLLWQGRLAGMLTVLALQSAVVALAAAGQGEWPLALAELGWGAVGLPWLLSRTPDLSGRFAAGGAAMLAAAAALAAVALPLGGFGPGLAVVLLGVLFVAIRPGASMLVAGLASLQNGAALTGLACGSHGMALLTAPLLPAVALVGIWLRAELVLPQLVLPVTADEGRGASTPVTVGEGRPSTTSVRCTSQSRGWRAFARHDVGGMAWPLADFSACLLLLLLSCALPWFGHLPGPWRIDPLGILAAILVSFVAALAALAVARSRRRPAGGCIVTAGALLAVLAGLPASGLDRSGHRRSRRGRRRAAAPPAPRRARPGFRAVRQPDAAGRSACRPVPRCWSASPASAP